MEIIYNGGELLSIAQWLQKAQLVHIKLLERSFKMHNIFTHLRLWLIAFTARPAPQSPLDTMSACELADLPASHPQC